MHWTDAYVGRPYIPDAEDCAYLAATVQREVFGREVVLPAERPNNPAEGAEMIARMLTDHAVRLTDPEEGAIVLMRRGSLARPWHVGTYFEQAGEAWILHATLAAAAATVVRLRDLPRFGFRVEGYYAWI